MLTFKVTTVGASEGFILNKEAVAGGSLDEKQLADWFRQRMVR